MDDNYYDVCEQMEIELQTNPDPFLKRTLHRNKYMKRRAGQMICAYDYWQGTVGQPREVRLSEKRKRELESYPWSWVEAGLPTENPEPEPVGVAPPELIPPLIKCLP